MTSSPHQFYYKGQDKKVHQKEVEAFEKGKYDRDGFQKVGQDLLLNYKIHQRQQYLSYLLFLNKVWKVWHKYNLQIYLAIF